MQVHFRNYATLIGETCWLAKARAYKVFAFLSCVAPNSRLWHAIPDIQSWGAKVHALILYDLFLLRAAARIIRVSQ